MTIGEHLPALQVVLPLLAAPLVVLLQPRGLAWAAATATSVFCFVLAINTTALVLSGEVLRYDMGGWPSPIGIVLEIDSLSALVLLIVTGASAATLLAARHSIDQQIDAHQQPMFYSAWLLALAGLAGMVVSADAFNIFVFMEISSLSAYVLIAGGPDRRALPAVFKYLIMGTIGATFYLIGVGLIYMMTGTLNLADMTFRLVEVSDQRPVLVAAGFITIGLGLKAAMFPLHVWLPNAYTHAPHMVTAFLAACGTKVSVYVLVRFDFLVFQSIDLHSVRFALFLMLLALMAILVASAVALFEGHLKRMLAFSSVAQIGYILLGASLLSTEGMIASGAHMFNHALAKGGLFLAVAALAMRYEDLRIDALAGAAKKMPMTSFALVIAGLSLIGIPGTAGFISKWLLITALLDVGAFGWIMVGLVVVSSLMAVGYVWRVVETLYFKTAVVGHDEVQEAPWNMLVVLWVVIALNIYFGLVPALPVELSEGAAYTLIRGLL